MAVVLASLAALTIPRAGAQDGNQTPQDLAAADGTPHAHDQNPPSLRQPPGWDRSANRAQNAQPPAEANAQSDSANQAQAGDRETITNGNQAAGLLNQNSRFVANQQTQSHDGAASNDGAALQTADRNTSQLSEGTQASVGNKTSTPPWQQQTDAGQTASEPAATKTTEVPEILTRDWTNTPNRMLGTRAEIASGTNNSAGVGVSLLDSLMPTASGLAIVVGLFLLCTWMLRKKLPRMVGALPTDVFEVLGKTSLDKKHKLHLVRCGGKLALLSVSANGIETLMEIEDADEVTRIAGMCQELRSDSSSAGFREVLSEMNKEPAQGWSKLGSSRSGKRG